MSLTNFLSDQIQQQDTYDYTLADVLTLRAQETPGKTAYIYLLDGESEEVVITYQELEMKARNIAAGLLEAGMTGERALMLYPPGPEFIFALFGCFYARVIAVPAYPPRKNRSLWRIKTIVNDSQAKVIMTTTSIFSGIQRNFADDEDLSGMDWFISDDPGYLSGGEPGEMTITPSTLALLQYTSGSTGNPKGVMITNRNIMRNSEFIRQCFRLTGDSVSVSWLPSFHDMGLIDGVLQPLYTGFPGVLIPPVAFLQKPIRWLEAFTRYKGTHGGAPNFAYDFCVDKTIPEERQQVNLSSIRTLYNGAEPVRMETLRRFTETFKPNGFGLEKFLPCYGMAETTLIISGGDTDKNPVIISLIKDGIEKNQVILAGKDKKNAIPQVSVGHSWIDTRVIIVNRDTCNRAAAGEIGEIWLAGSIIAQGYWNNPTETQATFQAYIADTGEGPFLRTGDLGFIHEGELYVSGRLKDLIIIHGKNYYPQDIEMIVEKCHPAIRPTCCAAFSVDMDDRERLVVIAEVERTFLKDLNAEDVFDSIRQAVAEEFELEVTGIQLLRTTTIPKTSSGKIQRSACKKGFLENTLDVVGTSILMENDGQPGTDESLSQQSMLEWIKSWMSSRFKIQNDTIDIHKPITSYGLNSMKAVELQCEFLVTYGINFPPYLFFEKISIEELTEKAKKLIAESKKDE
jgi:acyl-CoA synthetase (AMP-forming)/AMP-acid ligase II/acyl carrier protein